MTVRRGVRAASGITSVNPIYPYTMMYPIPIAFAGDQGQPAIKSDTFPVGQSVPLTFEVFDTSGYLAIPTSTTLTITLPDGSVVTPATTNTNTGIYTCDYTVTQVGRYVALFTATGPSGGAATDIFDVRAVNASLVTLADAKAYLGQTSWNDTEVQRALDAERAAQAAVCRIDDYGPDLREALFRRIARNLAARAVPIAQFTSFDGGGVTARVQTYDPEILRLEAPYRRMVIG